MKYLIALGLLFAVECLHSQSICIPNGSTPSIDGIVQTNEWSDADSVMIGADGVYDTQVKYKHDGSSLYISYNSYQGLLVPGTGFPEIYFDIENDDSEDWNLDDWWFHVSATDCESLGAEQVYDACEEDHDDWAAEPNFNMTIEVNFVEIEIPFSKLGVGTASSFGICFSGTANFMSWNSWPSSADRSTPATWATATICDSALNTEEESGENVMLYPNPAKNAISIKGLPDNVYDAEIRSVAGNKVYSTKIGPDDWSADLTSLSRGMYFIFIKDGNGSALGIHKFMKD